jgi:hypothetical protein
MKNKIGYLLLIMVFTFANIGCYKEVNPNDENFDIIGDVAQISELFSPVAAAPAGSVLNLVIKMNFVNTTIKELKFYERFGTAGTYTFVRSIPFVPNFVQAERVHVITVPWTLPTTKGRYSVQVEAINDQDLASARRTMTPTVFNIQ